MLPNKIYEKGKDIGLNKEDIDIILSAKQNIEISAKFHSPIEIYKGDNKYGTISLKDF